jgi:hypothetical protein
MIASPVQLLVPMLLHVIMDLKELHPKVGSPPSVADRPRGSGTAQTTSGGARSQSSPSRTQMIVAMKAETRIDVSSSLGNIHDREDPPGQTPQRRACRHWAVQWPALQNGCLNPRCAVLKHQQAYVEAGLVPNVSLPGGARRGRVLLGSRATTPFGLYKLGDTSFTARLGEFGRGAGVALGGSTASWQACPRAT